MKFTTLILSAIGALAVPTKNTPRSTPSRIDPELSHYNVWTGAIDHDVATGLVQKTNGPEPDITTLATFAFPASTAGRECQLMFPLDASSTATGSRRAQVFSSLAPAEQDTESWPPGNLRDQHLGDVVFSVPGGAEWEATYNDYARGRFPCPADFSLALELVGRWDEVTIKWTQGAAGPYVKVY